MSNYLEQGKTFLEKKEYSKALEYFQAAIESDESLLDAYLGLAEVYFAIQKEKQGREALFKALALDPFNEQGITMVQEHCLAKWGVVESNNNPIIDQAMVSPPATVSSNASYTIISPAINHTPYYAVEFADGNIIYLRKDSINCSVVAPNKENKFVYNNFVYNNWDGYKKPQGTIVIPNSVCIDGKTLPVVEIGDSAFSLCKINKVIIPDSIEVISECAFSSNELLKEVYIPNSVKSIQRYAFSMCQNLEKIHLPELLEVIDEYVFGHTKISSINIPASVKKIFDDAFYGAGGLIGNFFPKEMILHSAPPMIERGIYGSGLNIQKGSVAHVPSLFLQDYKFAKFWQEMKLIPY